ncbi:homeobox protein Hox-A4 isoform X2 [Triticum aestivum]|uniref:homeobox protein Hox-A4 isoform X2 n=1 Tax=Triticum aestivum TaxID=4565 RepID=UPI001D010E42|nr:homeobox protein Hox-A4-like isoform X2 [Triticum aestivum]
MPPPHPHAHQPPEPPPPLARSPDAGAAASSCALVGRRSRRLLPRARRRPEPPPPPTRPPDAGAAALPARSPATGRSNPTAGSCRRCQVPSRQIPLPQPGPNYRFQPPLMGEGPLMQDTSRCFVVVPWMTTKAATRDPPHSGQRSNQQKWVTAHHLRTIQHRSTPENIEISLLPKALYHPVGLSHSFGHHGAPFEPP